MPARLISPLSWTMRYALLVALTLVDAYTADAASPAAERRETHLYYEALEAKAQRDADSGRIWVDLDFLRQGLVPYLQSLGLEPAYFRIWLDGRPQNAERIAGGVAGVYLESRPPSAQCSIDVELLDAKHEPLHVTEPRLFESLNPTLFTIEQPIELVAAGPAISSGLITTSAAIQQRKGSWYLRPHVAEKGGALFEAFQAHGSELEVQVARGDHPEVRVSYLDAATQERQPIAATASDFYFTANADFSWHLFDWDRWLSGRYLRFYQPWLAQETIELALDTQQANGAWWRELNFHLQSYQRPYIYKFGSQHFNKQALNPPLAGWAVQAIAAWQPQLAAALIPRVNAALQRQRLWLEQEAALVSAENGQLLGFRWSALGSGRDNALRGDLYVDLLTYYKMLLDQERLFRHMLGEAGTEQLEAKAAEVKGLLNRRYWDETRGLYVDLTATADGSFGLDANQNAVGFWPALAGVPDTRRLKRLLANLHDPARFGGLFFPSLARNDPQHREIGHYWRGGGWPPDFAFLFDWLLTNGLRGEARREALRMLAAMQQASDAYKLGHTPYTFRQQKLAEHGQRVLDDPAVGLALAPYAGAAKDLRQGILPAHLGSILRDQVVHQALAKHPDTIWETLGVWRDAQGTPYVSWGKEVRADGSLHETRGGGSPGSRQHGFAGWGAIPLEAIRTGLGLDGVLPLLQVKPSAQDLLRWYDHLANNYATRQHQVWLNPRLARLRAKPRAELLSLQPSPDEEDELRRLAGGYLTLSPAYDPGVGLTRLSGLNYRGIPFALEIDHASDNLIRLKVTSPESFPLQVMRHWTRTGEACDGALAVSPLVEVGGKHTSIDIPLQATAWGRAHPQPSAEECSAARLR